MKSEVKFNEGDRVKYLRGAKICFGRILKTYAQGYEIEEEDTDKHYLINYIKILEKLEMRIQKFEDRSWMLEAGICKS